MGRRRSWSRYVLHWNGVSGPSSGGGSVGAGGSAFGAGEGGVPPEAAAAAPIDDTVGGAVAPAVPDGQLGLLGRLLGRVTRSVGVAVSPIGGRLLASLQRLRWWQTAPAPVTVVTATDVDAIVGAAVADDLGAVYEQLRLISPNAPVGEVTPGTLGRLRISFDVHRTDAHFKKSKRGDPDFRLCVANYTEDVSKSVPSAAAHAAAAVPPLSHLTTPLMHACLVCLALS